MSGSGNARLRLERTTIQNAVWLILIALLGLWVMQRLGGFDLWSTAVRADGTTERIVKTFGAADHPFHVSRAELMRQSLAHSDLLRWIAMHQGGYPVEFYPLGAPAFEVALWALLLGSLPMMAVHKLAVILVFLL